jgi:hypothetical protein
MTGRSDYQERREARIERLGRGAARARAEGQARIAAADALASRIPFGQPILVGHHSERRARRDREKIRGNLEKGFESLEHAKDLARRAAAAEENRAISSDDPEAITRLREKLAGIESQRERGRRLNAAYRRGGWEEVAKLAPESVATMRRDFERFSFDAPVPGYRLKNLGAEARRVAERIAQLEAAAARVAPAPETIGDVVISEEENRVQLTFPGKPSEAIRAALKGHGFRWAPSVGAWVRMASNTAWYWAREVAKLAAEPPAT